MRYLLPEGSLFNRVRAVLIPGVNNLAAGHQITRIYMTADYELGYSLPMTDKSQRVIAALEVEAAMTEAHAKRLSNIAPNLADPGRQREMAALVKEETDRAKAIREQIRLLRDQV